MCFGSPEDVRAELDTLVVSILIAFAQMQSHARHVVRSSVDGRVRSERSQSGGAGQQQREAAFAR
jgi:hypothetical protein